MGISGKPPTSPIFHHFHLQTPFFFSHYQTPSTHTTPNTPFNLKPPPTPQNPPSFYPLISFQKTQQISKHPKTFSTPTTMAEGVIFHEGEIGEVQQRKWNRLANQRILPTRYSDNSCLQTLGITHDTERPHI